MARPIKQDGLNLIVQQSNYITTARYDYTPQEKRILYRVVEKAFEYRLENQEYFNSHSDYEVKEHVTFTMPITAFMSKEQLKRNSGKDYDEIVDAFKSLVDKKISFQGKDEFSFGGILNYADRLRGKGEITFMVHRFVWKSALDFSKGFTKFDLVTAMGLKSAYSMRFFEIAKQWHDTNVWVVSVEEFKKLFQCENKYARLYDLKKYIIETARKELDAKSPISFTYEQEKKGRNVVSFKFTFKENRKNKSEAEERKELMSDYALQMLQQEIKYFLREKIGLTPKEIASNIKTWEELNRLFRKDALDELEETYQYLTRLGKRPAENKGLFINNIRAKIKNAKE